MSIHPTYRLLGNHMKSLYKHSTLQIYWVDSIHKGSQGVCAMQKINKGNHLTTLCLLAWVSVVQMSHLNLKKSLTHRFLLLSQLLIFGNEHTSTQFTPGTLELSHTVILPVSSLYPPFQSSVERVLSGGQFQHYVDKWNMTNLSWFPY